MSYVRGKGYPEIARRNPTTGDFIAPFIRLGDTSTFNVSFTQDNFEVADSIQGVIHSVESIAYKYNAKIQLTIREVNIANLVFALQGASVNQDVVSILSNNPEIFSTGLLKNSYVQLANKGHIIDLVLKDNTNAVLALNTDYIHDGYGSIKLLKVSGYTQPFKASYTALSHTRIPILNTVSDELWIRFWQVNTLKRNSQQQFEKRCIEFYRVKFDITDLLSMLQDNDITNINLVGNVLLDKTKPLSSVLSQYGNMFVLEPLDANSPTKPTVNNSTNITSNSATLNISSVEDESAIDKTEIRISY